MSERVKKYCSGKMLLPLSPVGVYNNHEMEDARAIIEGGKGMMPGFSYLTNNIIQTILNFLYGREDENTAMDDFEEIPERVLLPCGHNGFHRLLDQNGYPAIKPP